MSTLTVSSMNTASTGPQGLSIAETAGERWSHLEPCQIAKLTDAIAKGSELLTMMLSPEPGTQSSFLKPRLLKKRYTDVSRHMQKNHLEGIGGDYFSDIRKALSALGLDSTFSHDQVNGNNHVVSHEIKFELKYPRTANYTQIINPTDGIIVGFDNRSVLDALRWLGCDQACPKLKYWSDVAYLQWRMFAAADSDLKFILRYNVINRDTYAVLEAVTGYAWGEMDTWLTYDICSDEGRALLGTPNGKGVAWMLAQHREQLGWKTVDKVTVFDVGEDLMGCTMMLFHIVDVEQIEDLSP